MKSLGYKSIGGGGNNSQEIPYPSIILIASANSIDLERGAFFPPPTRQSQDIGIPYSPVKRLVSGWLVLTNERLGSRPFDQSEGSVFRQPAALSASITVNNV